MTIFLACSANSKSNECAKTILSDDVQRTFNICLLAGHKTLLESQTSGSFKLNFGTHDEMTREAKLLKTKAESGDPSFQYIWSLVLNHAYLMDFEWVNYSNSPAYIEMAEKQQYWVRSSAEGGFIEAMLLEVEGFLSPFYTGSAEEKLRIQRYVQILVENDIPGATRYIALIRNKNSTQDLNENLKAQFESYKNLPTQEIKELAHSLKSGLYYSDNGMGEVSTDIKRSEELYLYLVEKRNDSEAAYFLGKLIGKSDKRRALKYFQISADLNFPKGLGWIGDYQSCIGNNKSAIKYLNRAKALGYIYADDSLGEIKELGETNNCYGGWIE
ncbi:MAG: hypothetical protein COA86_15050 [Kangiella sp.]|nr:MAG: hypothetical protein COA86_15050 [Kangiella sp.]